MNNIPERWQESLEIHLNSNGVMRQLSAGDFKNHVRLQLPDGSFAFFRNAFYLVNRDLKEIAVFTEHCGYHYFPLIDAEVELYESHGCLLGS